MYLYRLDCKSHVTLILDSYLLYFKTNTENNALTDSIPSEFGKLSSLKTMNLGKNNLSGSIPTEMGNLSEMKRLNLGKSE